jgi:hypothetical protein
MSDDTMLFLDDGEPVDADVSLITAYLSGELSLTDEIAVDDRLERDAHFRARVQPIIDAWEEAPASLTVEEIAALRAREAPLAPEDELTEAEVEEDWNQFLLEEGEGEAKPVLALLPASPALPVSQAAAVPTPQQRFTRGRSRFFRQAVGIAAGFLVFVGGAIGLMVPLHNLDYEVHETLSRRTIGWFNRTIVRPDDITRRMEIDGGSVVTLGPASRLIFRPSAAYRWQGEVLNLDGTAVIEISERTGSASLFTPQARVVLAPGRYSVQSVGEDGPMTIGVLSGSATVYPRNTKSSLELKAGEYGQASKDHEAVKLGAAPAGMPK